MSLTRTFLFVPGSAPARVAKALTLEADAIIIDLEDAVAPDAKVEARAAVASLAPQGRGPGIFVRINSAGTQWHERDLEEAPGAALAGVMLPKSESAEQVARVAERLGEVEKRKSLPVGGLELIPLIESASGIQHAAEIAASTSRVRRLSFGALDYTLDIGAELDQDGTALLYPRSKLVVASRVSGICAPIDTVYPNLKDPEGFEVDCARGRTLGFGGKLVIHPSQIEPANRAFSPSPEMVEEAKSIVRAFDEAISQGFSSIQLNGQFVDKPVADRARGILAVAESLGL